MLRQDAPDERNEHDEKLVERPKPDQFGIIEMPRDRKAVHESVHRQLAGLGMGAGPPVAVSDRSRDGRCNDGDTGSGTNADTNGDRDLAETETARGKADNAAGKAEYSDDLAARALQKIAELGERCIECAVGAGKGKIGAEHGPDRNNGCCQRK